MSDHESVSVLGNRNLNAVGLRKHGSLNKPMSHARRFQFLLNPVFLRLVIKINYDQGRGPLTVGGPGSLNLLNPLLLRHCLQHGGQYSLEGLQTTLSNEQLSMQLYYRLMQVCIKVDVRMVVLVQSSTDETFYDTSMFPKLRCLHFVLVS